MSFARDTMRGLNFQNIRISPDEVSGVSGNTYAAITCVGANPNATAIVMAAADNNADTKRVVDLIKTKIAGIICFDGCN